MTGSARMVNGGKKMRMIDADELCKVLNQIVGSPEGDAKLMEINQCIVDVPTVNAIPVDWLKHRLVMAQVHGVFEPEQAIQYVLWLWGVQKEG